MPTVNEILKQSGLTDEQIAALDAKAITAFTGVLTTAEQERQNAQQSAEKAAQERKDAQQAAEKAEQDRKDAAAAKEAAEIAQRSNAEFYDKEIAPALNNWGTEKANLEAQAAFYRAQNEAARAAGFVPTEAPSYKPQEATTQQRDAQGRYVAGAPGSTPGSPTFTMEDVRNGLGSTLGTLTDIQWKYQRLFNEPLPISPTQLVREAEAQRLDPVAYAEKRFNFQAREQEIQRKAAEEHDAKIRAEASAPYEAKLKEAEEARQKAIAETDRKWAEKVGSNPDVRISEPSRFADVARAVKANERPDPLSLNESQRRQATSQAIRQEISETAAA
jgi:hypothetical protein